MNKFIQLACAALLSFSAFAAQTVTTKLDILNLKAQSENVLTSGQPSQTDFAKLKQLGVQNVINLRGDNETNWSEQESVTELGMNYYHIPVQSKADITIENATKLQALLNKQQQQTTLLHCASSNRVGALVALYNAVTLKKPIDEAVEIGKQWGLKSLEGVVRSKVNEEVGQP
ncbi:protein tyrosine phosphatase family protein [Pseudoalteromonas simplex]|uniref:protein tyrosine phosphatase family protein n=1 Tax=Pseudoalteromonas simplex TaxID=2783613 RepID=UPI0018877AAE|nr:protein tyrosine phosphatase family protein [Pseudoalteromonas sp. A520]|tara:strand:- start:773 stop:1291 length:519 start_codon:yes stop_codon:yes gene_type:complete